MSMRGVGRIVFYSYVILLHVLVIYLGQAWVRSQYSFDPYVPPVNNGSATPAPLPSEPEPTVETQISQTPQPTPSATPMIAGLIVPVQGVRVDQLTDTFTAGRASGKPHDAIDIMAPGGTPVVAAAPGKVVKFFDSIPGGITIYVLSEDERFMYYYAHLERRAEDVHEGEHVDQGKVIAYVGDTGNAGLGNTHLHFSIAQVADPKRYWEGTYLNPYPLLRSGTAPQ